ncbi:hypothetical protein C0V70_02165 [Bacteriovorax stolpii]|uniref:Uncharacterized protein n=1 Tax=Bacteriovorax stolpii TaxID=960 RepID=A0A2K9NN30_BACTC|nr:RodZ domain-containing protein [Bacteriovorax stolpii]AUN96929.1 hypothetical protein C0V70_02165 [Bacteriovorax stolpii]TDP53209.1 cytoskeletal protein RodZ [Bacteriovorax stolpii]
MTEENNTPENGIETTPVQETPVHVEPKLTIGQLIKKSREDKGLSLKVISQQTKIHIGLLESLEADEFEKLPSKAYVRGFVKSTSKILGINQEMALELLDTAYAKSAPQMHHPVPNQEMKTEAARNTLSAITTTPLETVKSVTASSTVFLAKSAVVILIVGIVGFNVKNFLEKSSEESEVKLPEVLSTLHKKKAPAPKPVAKVEPVEPKKEEPIQVNLIQDKNPKPAEVTVNDINLSTISIAEKQFAEEKMEKEQYDELLPAKYRIQPTKGQETVFINASEGDSWLTYKVDDKEIKKFVLRQGRTLFLRGSLIRLFVGNTRSLKVFYNNKPVNLTAGAKGGVKNIVLPEEMKTKYMAPLFVFQDDGSVLTSDEYLKVNQKKTPTPPPAPAAEAPRTDGRKVNNI